MAAIGALAFALTGVMRSRTAAADRPVTLALFSEDNLPAADMPPTPTATPAAPGETAPSQTAPGAEPQAASPAASPAEEPGALPGQATPAAPQPGSEAQPEPTPPAAPADIAPLEVGSIEPKGQISDDALESEISHSSSPALAASLRVTDQAREQILNNHPDDAVQTLGRAISIDPSNSYAYFYLGRAWLSSKNYDQALTFFKRAQIGFDANPGWLAETLSFEGLAYEQSGNSGDAVAAYQKAVEAEPGNLMARVALTRLAPVQTPAEPVQPAAASPGESEAQPPPAEGPAPGPPQSAPPPPAD